MQLSQYEPVNRIISNDSEIESLEVWCKNMTNAEVEELFSSFLALNWMWTGVSVVYFVGAMLGATLSRRFVTQFGR